ncbi:putative ribonuclease H protein [Nymphaea thermarum]|nr:putative ribonuclease H protein [Nymphaea thermarum]
MLLLAPVSDENIKMVEMGADADAALRQTASTLDFIRPIGNWLKPMSAEPFEGSLIVSWMRWSRRVGSKSTIDKSQIVGLHPKKEQLAQAVSITRWPASSLPIRDLGLPLQAKRLAAHQFQPLMLRMESKLSVWKQRMLSQIVLGEDILATIPHYCGIVVQNPTTIFRRIDCLCYFLGGGSVAGKKCHLVSWNQLCFPKDEGGVGLKDQMVSNKAALGFLVVRAAASRFYVRLLQQR